MTAAVTMPATSANGGSAPASDWTGFCGGAGASGSLTCPVFVSTTA